MGVTLLQVLTNTFPAQQPPKLLDQLRADSEVAGTLSEAGLAACFDDAHHFTRVEDIFARVFAP